MGYTFIYGQFERESDDKSSDWGVPYSQTKAIAALCDCRRTPPVAGGNTTVNKPCAFCFCAIWQLKNKGLVTSVLEACKSRPGGLLILLLGPV